MKKLDQYRGCLLGGAIGDALGYTVEFFSYKTIIQKYGSNGITDFELSHGQALISDDTQMTLATAFGLLATKVRRCKDAKKKDYIEEIGRAYRIWYLGQIEELEGNHWLFGVPGMTDRRAPGNTCLNSLSRTQLGSLDAPINDSCGCGGVMRVAPIGLLFPEDASDFATILGAESAALTHSHELGYLPSAAQAYIVHNLANRPGLSVSEATRESIDAIARLFSPSPKRDAFFNLLDKAVDLARQAQSEDVDAINQLGEGWVGDEALAIALYASIRHENDFERAIVAAVNHSGDSDSTGAIAGNILGAKLGASSIPTKYIQNLECRELIDLVAEDLFIASTVSDFPISRPDVATRYESL